MEIVLTADERAQIHKDAADAFFLKDDGAYDGLSFPESVKLAQQELLASIDESLCRAQVKKLIEWLEGDCTEHEPSIFAFTLPVERKDCPECWAALIAAGEGK